MDETYNIFDYVPWYYKSPTDEKYFSFLFNSIQQNYNAKNYHFALVALHMVYMGVVYHYIYAISKADPKRFEHVLIGFHSFLERKESKDFDDLAWQDFSLISESNIFQFYRAVGIPKDQIGDLKKPVEKRNDMLHANGIYLSQPEEFADQSQRYRKNLEKIHKFCFPEYQSLFSKFLDEFKIEPQDEREALEYLEQDFIRKYNLNHKTLVDLAEQKNSSKKKVSILFHDLLKKSL